MKRNLYILLAALVLVGVALFQNVGPGFAAVFQSESSKELPAETGPKAGLLAPPFSLQGLDGNTYKVGGQQDKAIMINFWASWCDPCKEEAPDLNRLAQKYKDDLVIYGVNVTKFDKVENAKQFVNHFNLTYPVMFDKEGKVNEAYKGVAFPTNVLVDKHGVIQEVILGILPPDQLESKIKKLIK
ncbi:TlpA disulfide reductase family protein [Paenibacillus sediminis]|uniref:Thiol-disulfide isomerase/thioredoxin n=1 Tax=Paenibacillus sediminis TaxID=664909 RepID=A0ABS4H5D3_9BACL|nr:TlpA disulfide reductase family protein [Paenibacillus sediminis]MBP1937734.1 thiol-disulfide isomerase/thioredoxin [Paenibacillus sediminis]